MKCWVPDYMVPSVFVALETIPLTPNGKVDRGALPAPKRQRPLLEIDFVLPRTPAEQRLAAIWTDILQIDDVGVQDDFLALGGHSLLAVRLFERIEQLIGCELPEDIYFGQQTIERQAGVLHGLLG